MVDSVGLILLVKMRLKLISQNEVEVDRQSSENQGFVSGHDFSRAEMRSQNSGLPRRSER